MHLEAKKTIGFVIFKDANGYYWVEEMTVVADGQHHLIAGPYTYEFEAVDAVTRFNRTFVEVEAER